MTDRLVEETYLWIIQKEMVLAHQRDKWDTVRYLAPIARELRLRELYEAVA